MSVNIKALIKKSGLLTLAYVLALSSVSVVMPYLVTEKASAWTKDITSLVSSPAVSTAYGTPVDIKVTAKEGDEAGWVGFEEGTITATVQSGKGTIVGKSCSPEIDWPTASNTTVATVSPSNSSEVEYNFTTKKWENVSYLNVDFCFNPSVAANNSVVVTFDSILPFTDPENINCWFILQGCKKSCRPQQQLLLTQGLLR